MSNPAVVVQVGEASLKAGQDVDVGSVAGQDQRHRGKARLAIKPRLADGNGGQGVGKVVHGKIRSQEPGVRRQNAVYGTLERESANGELAASTVF